jgi:hypothetical protein
VDAVVRLVGAVLAEERRERVEDGCARFDERRPQAAGKRELLAGALLTVNPGVERTINLQFNRCSDDRGQRAPNHGGMTTSEYLINAAFAAALVLSGATVKTHLNHIFARTGARDRAQAVRNAYQHEIA